MKKLILILVLLCGCTTLDLGHVPDVEYDMDELNAIRQNLKEASSLRSTIRQLGATLETAGVPDEIAVAEVFINHQKYLIFLYEGDLEVCPIGNDN